MLMSVLGADSCADRAPSEGGKAVWQPCGLAAARRRLSAVGHGALPHHQVACPGHAMHLRGLRSDTALLCRHSYSNWLVQLNPGSLRLVAISRRPVLQSDSYKLEGYFEGVLIVGSFHVLDVDGRQVGLLGCSAEMQRIQLSFTVCRCCSCSWERAISMQLGRKWQWPALHGTGCHQIQGPSWVPPAQLPGGRSADSMRSGRGEGDAAGQSGQSHDAV